MSDAQALQSSAPIKPGTCFVERQLMVLISRQQSKEGTFGIVALAFVVDGETPVLEARRILATEKTLSYPFRQPYVVVAG
jgi:hypothetical protein